MRCHRLFGRSKTAREKWLQRPEIHQILNHFLRTKSVPYHDRGMCIETDPILSASATMEISPGEQAQDMHRDEFIWQRTHVGFKEKYEPGSDVSMGIIVPGVETTVENGATAVRTNLYPRCYRVLTINPAVHTEIPSMGPFQMSRGRGSTIRGNECGRSSYFSDLRSTAAVLTPPAKTVQSMAFSSAVRGCDQR